MSTIIERAEADLRKAEEAASRAIQERDLCRVIVQRLKNYATGAATTTSRANGHAKPEKLTVAEAIERVLQDAGKPLLVEEIIEGLRLSGRAVKGKDPKANIASVLSRSKPRFSYQKGRGWSSAVNAPTTGE